MYARIGNPRCCLSNKSGGRIRYGQDTLKGRSTCHPSDQPPINWFGFNHLRFDPLPFEKAQKRVARALESRLGLGRLHRFLIL